MRTAKTLSALLRGTQAQGSPSIAAPVASCAVDFLTKSKILLPHARQTALRFTNDANHRSAARCARPVDPPSRLPNHCPVTQTRSIIIQPLAQSEITNRPPKRGRSNLEDCSTAELIREIAELMGKSARLFALPQWLVGAGMTLVGRRSQYDRLVGSLQLDISSTVSMLGWWPPVSRRDGLARTVAWYSGWGAAMGP